MKQQLAVELVHPELIDDYLASLSPKAVRQMQVLLSLKNQPLQLASELCEKTKASYHTLKALQAKGYISVEPRAIERELELPVETKPVPVLTSEQREALQVIIEEFHEGIPRFSSMG